MTTLRPRSSARNPVATTCSGVRRRPIDAASPAMSKKGVARTVHRHIGYGLKSCGGRNIYDGRPLRTFKHGRNKSVSKIDDRGHVHHDLLMVALGGKRLEEAIEAKS